MKYVYDDGGRAGPAALPMDKPYAGASYPQREDFPFFFSAKLDEERAIGPLFPMT
jgi:hypothetical protein